jgi:hypothetical protein
MDQRKKNDGRILRIDTIEISSRARKDSADLVTLTVGTSILQGRQE